MWVVIVPLGHINTHTHVPRRMIYRNQARASWSAWFRYVLRNILNKGNLTEQQEFLPLKYLGYMVLIKEHGGTLKSTNSLNFQFITMVTNNAIVLANQSRTSDVRHMCWHLRSFRMWLLWCLYFLLVNQ